MAAREAELQLGGLPISLDQWIAVLRGNVQTVMTLLLTVGVAELQVAATKVELEVVDPAQPGVRPRRAERGPGALVNRGSGWSALAEVLGRDDAPSLRLHPGSAWSTAATADLLPRCGVCGIVAPG